jgi:hypothetical protein
MSNAHRARGRVEEVHAIGDRQRAPGQAQPGLVDEFGRAQRMARPEPQQQVRLPAEILVEHREQTIDRAPARRHGCRRRAGRYVLPGVPHPHAHAVQQRRHGALLD